MAWVAIRRFLSGQWHQVKVRVVNGVLGPSALTEADLPPATPVTLADLQRANLKTRADVWRSMTADGWSVATLLERANDGRHAPLDELDLVEVVALLAEQDAARMRGALRGRLSRRLIPALLLLLALVSVLWKLARPLAPARPQVVVTRAGGLPAYHKISLAEVETKDTPFDAQAASTTEQVAARYAVRSLRLGEVVRMSDLRDATRLHDLNERTILTVPVGAVDGVLAESLPAVVTLLCSDRTGAARERFDDVYLLAISAEPPAVSAARSPGRPLVNVAAIALSPETVAALHPLIHARLITVAWQSPR
jgi:hypothetical protein